MSREQRIIHFSGSVQGVGFRYTTHQIAAGYDIGGYVRNLPDGRVECVVEGEPAEIDAFINELKGAMGGYIHRQTQQRAPSSEKLNSFTVKF